MQHDFDEGMTARIEATLVRTFREGGFEIFDFRMVEKPDTLSDDMKHFWGGYGAEFKLVTAADHATHKGDIDALRKRAINLGQGTRFLIDISRFEFVEGKQLHEVDGTVIYVYSPAMIVAEKLRAICQQMPEYGPIVRRSRAGAERARDFVDIHVLVNGLGIDLLHARNQRILRSMFAAKKVPLRFLGKIRHTYDFHVAGAAAVKDTVAPDFDLKDFRVYFDYVVALVDRLKPLWDE